MCTTPPIFKHGGSKTSLTLRHAACLSMDRATRLRTAGLDRCCAKYNPRSQRLSWSSKNQSVTQWCYWIVSKEFGGILLAFNYLSFVYISLFYVTSTTSRSWVIGAVSDDQSHAMYVYHTLRRINHTSLHSHFCQLTTYYSESPIYCLEISSSRYDTTRMVCIPTTAFKKFARAWNYSTWMSCSDGLKAV
jgi:hypothetical protein